MDVESIIPTVEFYDTNIIIFYWHKSSIAR